jgi:hypothetical protein
MKQLLKIVEHQLLEVEFSLLEMEVMMHIKEDWIFME